MSESTIGFERFFLGIAPLSQPCIQALQDLWTVSVEIPRKGFLYQPGQVGEHLYYVKSGEMWIYFSRDGKEICVGLSYADTLISAAASFISGAPTRYSVQAITPTQLIGIRKSDLMQVLETYPEFERAWRKMTEFVLLGRMDREYEIVSLTPEERYLALWERSPQLFGVYSQRILASYLGMTPEHFSRVKRKVHEDATS